jgi:hypothetical protein
MLQNQLIITIAGKKGGGKNTLGNFCVGYYLKHLGKIDNFRIEKNGTLSIRHFSDEYLAKMKKARVDVDGSYRNIKNGEFNPNLFDKSVKLYSFADPLKEFCMNVLGLTFQQCHGTDTQKNELTHCVRNIPWKNPAPDAVKTKYITAREVLQIFGTEMVRSLWQDAWAFATYKRIKDEGYDLAIITDARFKNEIEMGLQYGAKAIRLERSISTTDLHESETALDDYPDSKFDTVIHNANMTITEQNEVTAGLMERWLHEN